MRECTSWNAGVGAGSVSLSTVGAGAKGSAAGTKGKKAKDSSGEPWIKGHRPTRNQIELGIYGGIMLPAKGILFDVDKDTIEAKSKPTLDGAAKVLKDFAAVKVQIIGHTEADGDRDHNVDLSRRRAEAVKKYLIDKGTDTGRISIRGAGPDEPIVDNKTAEGKAPDRRIEFKRAQ